MTEYFFLNFADGLLRHCWGSNKHKKNYTCCPPLRMENFELFLPSFVSFNVPLFLENNSHERFQKCSWCYFDSHYTPKKLLNNTLFWSWLWVIFGLNLMYVLIFLENQSMFSHENLCRWKFGTCFFRNWSGCLSSGLLVFQVTAFCWISAKLAILFIFY